MLRSHQNLILYLLMCYSAVATAVFTPGLPAMQAYFGISIAASQLMISLFYIGSAFGRLPYGPLANRFGRKIAVQIGTAISVLGSVLCVGSVFSNSFDMLLVGRVLQALGCAAGIKIGYTMIADSYPADQMTRVIGRFSIYYALASGIGIGIGGWLTEWFGWASCFYFLTVFGVILLGASFFLPETASHIDHEALRLYSIVTGYSRKLKNRVLILSALLAGSGSAIAAIYSAKAPFIGINLMHLSPGAFGNYNFIPPLGYLAGGFAIAWLAARFSFFRLLFWSIILCIVLGGIVLASFAIGYYNFWTLFATTFLIYASETIVFSNVYSYGLTNAKDKSNASAMMSFINTAVAGLGVVFVQLVYPDSPLLMPVSFLFLFILMLIFWAMLKNQK